MYNQFHACYLSSVSKWEKTTTSKKQEIQDARIAHKRAMNEASNNILVLQKEISGLRGIETAAQTEAEKQQNIVAAESTVVDLGRRTRAELEREQAALKQNVAITLDKLKMRQNGI